MTRYESFRKIGPRYEKKPFYSCNVPSEVFTSLSHELIGKYLYRNTPSTIRKIERKRCPYCGSFDEITIYREFPNGERIKTVYTVPIS